MARGWESKSIESQIDDASRKSGNGHPPPSEEERQRQARINNLMLSRTRVCSELQRCCNSRFRPQLESELAFLEQEIKKLTH
jgi:hypothetical protein